MKILRYLLIVFNGVLFSFATSTDVAASEAEIWQKLTGGGLVVLMRHASTNRGEGSGAPLIRDPSCSTERMLSSQGRKEAALIGQMFTAKGIPVGDVRASPYCRTTDTAQIAFGRSTPTDFLSVLHALSEEQAEIYTEQLTVKIGSYSGSKNLVLVTHAPNIDAVSFDPVAQGAFLVLEPTGNDTFEEIGIIDIAD